MMLSGQLFEGVTITDDAGANIFFDVVKNNGKTKKVSVYKGDVFSVQKAGQEEQMYYVQDALNGFDMSEKELRYYIYGEADARNNYKPWPSSLGSFLFAAGGTVYMEGGFVPTALPFVYSLGMQIPYIKIRESTISDPAYTLEPTYKAGYNKSARSKKFIKNLTAGFAGFVVGTVIYEVSQ